MYRTQRHAAIRILCLAVAVAAGLGALRPADARACSVPVFRYALERWPPDFYYALAFYKGELTPEQKKVVTFLEKTADSDDSYANLGVRAVNVDDKKIDKRILDIYKASKIKKLPALVVLFPPVFREPKVAWQGPLTLAAAKQVVDSPARREIAKRILAGQSAVWLFLESGKPKVDAAALKTLTTALAKMQKQLRLPSDLYAEEDLGPAGTAPDSDPTVDPSKLKVGFSILKISRKDPAEAAFIHMLLRTEDELDTKYAKDVMAFPFFGRGRALYALVGEGIHPINVQDACEFLVGACSCQVKRLNPGTDALMVVDWESRLEETLIQDAPTPALPGAIDTAAPTTQPTTQPGSQLAAQPARPGPTTRPAGPEMRADSRPVPPVIPTSSKDDEGTSLLPVVLWTVGGVVAVGAVTVVVIARRGAGP